MCHQVPRQRRTGGEQAITFWPGDRRQGRVSVTVIGGEPFALPGAISFIRQFAADPDFDAVNLAVHQRRAASKHMQSLRQKRKLTVCVSLDSIHGLRASAGGQWDRSGATFC
jgi:hypothetical protein